MTTKRRKPRKPIQEPSFWRRHQLKIIKSSFVLFGCTLITVTAYQLHASYLNYIDPNNVYGDWFEIGAPPYKTEQLSFTPDGVFRNHRLISTQFEFDGKHISIATGAGLTQYQISGSHLSPQIRRIKPALPDQRFVLKGFEHTVQGSDVGSASKRRAALSEHFSNN
ncbi:DUF2850 domain-containing protein [Vibrio sp. B1REV9]|uniref:DUF2850 domain-containing protein n=1 Tax=Vibrio sp. B1REV9 TaxID=2751179 RepID=UPI001BAC9DC9|nr:DUF2850 domain-containing protein [Vibrio sp. B1REV9]